MVIVAGGSGSRMRSDIPKQFLEVNGRPILMYTIDRFAQHKLQPQLIVVLPKSSIATWETLCKQHNFTSPHKIITGGQTRYHSVLNGLNSINTNEGTVAIHDGVRMFVPDDCISACFTSAENLNSGVPCVASKDSLRKIKNNGNTAVNREDYKIIQTPQVFDLSLLKRAFELPYQDSFTDDASVFENAGHSIHLVEGDYKNIKITTPEDLLIAETFLKNS